MHGYYHTSQGLKDSMDYQFLQVPFLKFMLSPVFTLVQRLLWVDFCWKNHCIEVRHLGFHHSMFWPSFRENLFLEVFPVVCSCFQLLSSSLDFLGVYKLLSKLNLWQSLVGFGLQWVWKNEKKWMFDTLQSSLSNWIIALQTDYLINLFLQSFLF